ncbi:MAG: RodZ domain-containing protein [Pseudomonadota bacterium]
MAESETPQDAAVPADKEDASGKEGPGHTLRAAREARGQSAADVARNLCLELRLVQAIEDDRYEEFGAAVFARGHVRRYAQSLDMDADAILRSWDERNSSAPPPTVPDPKVAPVAERSSGMPVLLIAVVVAALAGGAGFVWWWLHPPPSGNEPVAAAPSTSLPEAAPPRSFPASAAPATTRNQSLDKALESAATAIETTVENLDSPTEQAAQDELAALTERAPATLPALPAEAAPAGASAVVSETQPAADSGGVDVAQAIAAAGPSPVGAGEEVALRFIFDESCWVSVRDATGRTLMLGLREPGTVNDRTGVPPINVTLGRYPGVRIEVDAQPFEVPPSGIDGAIARFEIPAP